MRRGKAIVATVIIVLHSSISYALALEDVAKTTPSASANTTATPSFEIDYDNDTFLLDGTPFR